MGHAVGIDLGTTFSVLALVGEDGQAHAIANAENAFTTPSVALWHQGIFLVGQPALDLVYGSAEAEREQLTGALIRGVKRMIGNPPMGGLYSNGRNTTPIEISTAILNKLVRDAEARLGFPVKEAVITVPAHFGDKERNATKEAAEKAGLSILQIINEPSAAALTYTHGRAAGTGIALVFDLGGGTFDATLLQLNGREARVLATKGIEELGGINFTNALAVALRRRYEAETKTTYPGDSISQELLILIAETAKCKLSTAPAVTIHLAPPQGKVLNMEITRTYFESLIKLLLLQLQVAVEQALERGKKQPEEVQRILLCGGSSRIPAVQNMLSKFFGKPPESILDLDLSVALGAAYQAAAYKEENRTHMPVLMLEEDAGLIIDCVSYPVGIAVQNARREVIKLPMLQPGDPLDAWSQAYPVRILGAVTNFPPIDVYSGEGSQLSQKDYLGSIALALPPETPSGARASVQMRQDQSGMVQIQITIEGRNLPGKLDRV